MTSPRKGQCAITFISGGGVGSGSRFTMRSEVKSGWRSGKSRIPVPAASTARPSRRRVPPGSGGTTRGKKINGVKRHILVDTLGLLLAVVVHPANIQDRDGARLVLEKLTHAFGWVRLIWVDGG